MVGFFAYRDKTGAARMYGGFRERIEADAEPGTIKEMDRLPIRGEEILDPTTLTIVPVVPTKEELIEKAESTLQNENYALAKMVLELREKLAATGVKLDPVPQELQIKLDAIDGLKMDEMP